MRNYILGLLLTACLPIAWKLLPMLVEKISGPINEAVKALLRKTKSLWSGHAKDIEAGIDEAAKEIKEDVDEVDKE